MTNHLEFERAVGPQGLWVTEADELVFTAWGQGAAVVMLLNARLVTVDGDVVVSSVRNTTSAGLDSETEEMALFPGWLMQVSVQPQAEGLVFGTVFARVVLRRGGQSLLRNSVVLWSGVVGVGGGVVWPGGDSREAVTAEGAVVSVSVANPAAGANWSSAENAALRTRLLACSFRLVTDATVATREVQVRGVYGGAIGWLGMASQSQTASNTRDYFGVLGFVQTAVIAGNIAIPLPGHLDARGTTYDSLVANMVAGDQLSNVQYLVERRFEPVD